MSPQANTIPPMQYRTLGRTGLRVSVVSLGAGGASRMGEALGLSEADRIALIHRALDLGVNLIDTSVSYGDTETTIGKAVRGRSCIVAIKFVPAVEDRIVEPGEVITSVEQSLQRLNVPTLDILQFHGVKPKHYKDCMERLLPTVQRLREQGKFRYLGISEMPPGDGEHRMLPMALADDHFDAIMVGYNFLAPYPEQVVLPEAQRRNVGVIVMVAVRRALSRPDHLQQKLNDAITRGVIAPDALPPKEPLNWLLSADVPTLPAAGYKFAAAHPAVATVLTGTSNRVHLEANLRAALGPPLPKEHLEKLRRVFANVREPLAE